MNSADGKTRQWDYLSLINPPVVLAAAAESLAGVLLGGARLDSPKPYLVVLTSAAAFAAGSTFSHYFDRGQDEDLHPDRPLPAERVNPATAWSLACGLLVLAALFCGLAGGVEGRTTWLVGTGLILLVVLYAAVTKSIWGAGFLTLAAARGLNLLLGLTATEWGLARYPYLPVPVVLFALGWALIRASRQPRAPQSTGFMALLHLVAAVSVVVYISGTTFSYRGDAVPFALGSVALTFPRFVNAVLDPRPVNAAAAVQYGFLGLTLLDAALAAGCAGFTAGLLVGTPAYLVYLALRRWPISLAAA